MATLKEHQAAMVDLLANGSGIPASASRLAHAMQDMLSTILSEPDLITKAVLEAAQLSQDATTPGLNDKALSKREKALKTNSPAKWPTPSEQRVKELENTIRQLKEVNAEQRDRLRSRKKLIDNLQGDNAKLRGFLHEAQDELKRWGSCAVIGEQAGCRKPDTQVCNHEFTVNDGRTTCLYCGAKL